MESHTSQQTKALSFHGNQGSLHQMFKHTLHKTQLAKHTGSQSMKHEF